MSENKEKLFKIRKRTEQIQKELRTFKLYQENIKKHTESMHLRLQYVIEEIDSIKQKILKEKQDNSE